MRNVLGCLGFAVALVAASAEVRAEGVCEPELRPELCIPGVSTAPECRVQGPLGAPSAGGTVLLAAPELVLPVALPQPAPATRRGAFARTVLGAPRAGYARGIDRPPKHDS